MTRILKFCSKHLKILRMLTIFLNFFLLGTSDGILVDNGTLIGPHNGKGSLELSTLTKSLILASSPFINLSDKSEAADGATVSKQSVLQNDDHNVPIVFGSPSDPLRDEMDNGGNNGDKIAFDHDLGDTKGDESQINEVRVKPPFAVTKDLDRNGKSLYSPGPTTDRKEFDYAYEEPLYRDTEPRFLKKTIESISHFFTQSFAKNENNEKLHLKGGNFKPVSGSEKLFPPQIEGTIKKSNGSYSQPLESGHSSTSSWKPSHRLEKVTDVNQINQNKDESNNLNNIKEEERKNNIHKKEELARLNKLLKRQRLIKEEYLKTLGVSTQNPSINHMKLEEGTPPTKNKTKEKEIKAERYTAPSPFLEKPFIGTYDISDETVNEEKHKRKRRKNRGKENRNTNIKFPGFEKDGPGNKVEDSEALEDQSRSENTLVPIYVSTAQPSVHNHDHLRTLFAVNENEHNHQHNKKLPTVFYNDFHSDPHYLDALKKFKNEYALKSHLSKPNINRDIRLEIPITLDAKISIPEYQKEFGELFKNYTPRFVLRDELAHLGEDHRYKAKDDSHKYSMSEANHAQPKPQNQKKNYQASLQPQTNGNAYLLPKENFQTLYGMASFLADSEISNKPSKSYDVPNHMLHIQPPSQLYQTPITQKPPKEPSTLYDLPHKKPEQQYETPRKPLSLFEALQSMAPPNRLYEIPEISHTGYGALIGPTNNPLSLIDASSALYNAPLKQPEGGYKPPEGYDYSPPKGYKASNNPTFPKGLYEAPKNDHKSTAEIPEGYDYTPPKGYDASKNPTFPKQLYEAPKPKIEEDPAGYTYKPPHGYKASENPTFPKALYEAPDKTKKEDKPTASYETPPKGYQPPNGYDYKAPDGYKPSENPTFPNKLYEAPQKETSYEAPKGYSPPEGYDYKVPKGYKAGDNPTFPTNLYNVPDVTSDYEAPSSKGYKPTDISTDYKPPKGYSPPEGYDYKAPEGYKAERNPTFPNKLYEAPEVSPDYKPPTAYEAPPKGYNPPEGYDYKAPSGYKADTNPTFPKKLYETPEVSTDYKPPTPVKKAPQNGYSPPQGYDYKTPKGYDASKNPTFPQESYAPPKLTDSYDPPEEDYGPPEQKYEPPPSGYTPPSGYDYKTPKGYDAAENPTFPKKGKKKLLSGYEAPDGYDYKTPSGYKASENPTFPKKLYDAPEAPQKSEHKSAAAPAYKAGLDTGYTPPGQEHKELHLPRKSHKRKKKPEKGYSPPAGYDYKTPDGYNAAENPTFPKKSHKETHDSYKPPDGYDYSPPEGYEPSDNPTFPKTSYEGPPKEKANGYSPPNGYDYSAPENYDPAQNPTFPKKHHKNPEYEAPHLGYTYDIPSENYDPSLNPTYPKHRFNIIIKNKDKPDTELLIRPESGYAPPDLIYKPPENNYRSEHIQEITPVNKLYEPPTIHGIDKKSGPSYNPDYNPTFPNHKLHNRQLNAKPADTNSKQGEYKVEEKYGVPTGLAKLALNTYEKTKENAAIVHNAPKNLYETPGDVESEKSVGTHNHLSKDKENREIGYKGEKPPTNYEPPEKYRKTSHQTNKVSTPTYQTPDTLYRIDLKNQLQESEGGQHDVDFVVDTKANTVTRNHPNVSSLYDPPKSLEDLHLSNKAHQEHAKKILSDLLKGTEQLLFSFVVPSTFCSTDNIMELQKLVTQGCDKLQRKLLFADSLAKLPYKIGAIRGILTNLVNALTELQEENKRTHIVKKDITQVFSIFQELQKSTHGLCRGQASLPVLAVDLQKSCDLLQDAKVVTIFNMIAVPCFVYQGAVGLLGERLQYIIEE